MTTSWRHKYYTSCAIDEHASFKIIVSDLPFCHLRQALLPSLFLLLVSCSSGLLVKLSKQKKSKRGSFFLGLREYLHVAQGPWTDLAERSVGDSLQPW